MSDWDTDRRNSLHTFLQRNETPALWMAYLVTTSSMRVYSSEELRSADKRAGTL